MLLWRLCSLSIYHVLKKIIVISKILTVFLKFVWGHMNLEEIFFLILGENWRSKWWQWNWQYTKFCERQDVNMIQLFFTFSDAYSCSFNNGGQVIEISIGFLSRAFSSVQQVGGSNLYFVCFNLLLNSKNRCCLTVVLMISFQLSCWCRMTNVGQTHPRCDTAVVGPAGAQWCLGTGSFLRVACCWPEGHACMCYSSIWWLRLCWGCCIW